MKEVWDAYDRDGNQLGFDLIRDEPIPEGVYHIVVEVYTVTENHEVLMTQRHPNKPLPLKWEVTGGSILKGETPEQGAIRELKEETGIEVTPSDLNFVYSYVHENNRSIYKCFVVFISKERTKIQLQEGETVHYRYITYNEFKQFMKTEDYVAGGRDRFYAHEKRFDTLIPQNGSIVEERSSE